MLRFRFILFAAALLAAAPLFVHAQTEAGATSAPTAKSSGKTSIVPFRIGMIYSGELSRQKPAFDVESEFDQPQEKNPAWIELIVKIENERSISRFDYELIGQEDTYSCFAVAEGNAGYSVAPEKWIIKKTSTLKYYRLLFPVKQSEINRAKNGLLPVTLRLKLYETKLDPAQFGVRVMPNGDKFTSVSSPYLPGGLCNKNFEDAFSPRK